MELTVGPHLVEVLSGPEVDLELAAKGLVGESDCQHLTIKVRSDLPRSVWHETVVHELLHHIISLTHLDAKWSEDEQEEVIRAISPMLSAAVRIITA